MLIPNNFIVPSAAPTETEGNAVLWKLPQRPFVVHRETKKYLYRAEKWGHVEYDYLSDQFSAFVSREVQNPLPRAPLGLYWLVTAPCNLRCIHCYGNVEELPRDTVSEKDQERIADQIIQSGVMRVTLNGGEPLLRKDTPRIIEKLADNNIAVVLGTNGTYLTESIMGSVKRTSLVDISFDSYDEATNNAIRPSRSPTGNAYQEALRAIKLCIAHNVKLRVLTCINNRNVTHVEAIGKILYACGVRDWSISWTLFAGRARFIYNSLASNDLEVVQQAVARIQEKYPDMKVKLSNRSNSAENNRYSCLVFPNGRVFAEDLALGRKISYESLLKTPLSASWNSANFNIDQHFARWTGGRIHQV